MAVTKRYMVYKSKGFQSKPLDRLSQN